MLQEGRMGLYWWRTGAGFNHGIAVPMNSQLERALGAARYSDRNGDVSMFASRIH
jgi:hypothetical protein